jgi:transcription antitermination factor NusB
MLVDSKNLDKSYSRLMAVQVFYSLIVAENYSIEKLDENINYFIQDAPIGKNRGVKFNSKFIKSLVLEAIQNKEKIIETINRFATKQASGEKVDKLIEAILYIALAEILVFPQTPKKVLIKEYNNITSEFYNDDSVKFVNAILNQSYPEDTSGTEE